MALVKRIETAGRAMLDLLYPSFTGCVYCHAECETDINSGLCKNCLEKLEIKVYKFAVDSGSLKIQGYAPLVLDGMARDMVHALKYENKRYLAVPIARLMAWAFTESQETADIVTFVPLHVRRKRERGYNQSRLLAENVASILGLECYDLLSRIRYTKSQIEMDLEQRKENMKDAFECKDGATVKCKKILLLDDVCTSGSTSAECARMLLQAKAATVVGLYGTFAGK